MIPAKTGEREIMQEKLTADHLWAAMWEMFPDKNDEDLRMAFNFGALWVDPNITQRFFGSGYVE